MSGKRGVGRTLDRLLQSSGRRLESAMARIGESFGFGPHALMVRLFSSQATEFDCCENCRDARKSLCLLARPTLSDILGYIFLWPCAGCLPAFERTLLGPVDDNEGSLFPGRRLFRHTCAGLVRIIRCVPRYVNVPRLIDSVAREIYQTFSQLRGISMHSYCCSVMTAGNSYELTTNSD
jgi:hypothetical protein